MLKLRSDSTLHLPPLVPVKEILAVAFVPLASKVILADVVADTGWMTSILIKSAEVVKGYDSSRLTWSIRIPTSGFVLTT